MAIANLILNCTKRHWLYWVSLFPNRSAYTEISVLYDILNIVKEKHYMVTDPVSQDSPELKAPLQMLAKKKVCT